MTERRQSNYVGFLILRPWRRSKRRRGFRVKVAGRPRLK